MSSAVGKAIACIYGGQITVTAHVFRFISQCSKITAENTRKLRNLQFTFQFRLCTSGHTSTGASHNGQIKGKLAKHELGFTKA
jgi:hypothetical protein